MDNASDSSNKQEIPNEMETTIPSTDQTPKKKQEWTFLPKFGFLNPWGNQITVIIDGQTYHGNRSTLTWILGILMQIMLILSVVIPIGYSWNHPYVLIPLVLFVITGTGYYLSYTYDRRQLKKKLQHHKSN